MTTYLTTKQLQELLKIDRVTVYRMVNDGRLKGVKFGNQWRFAQEEVDRILGTESPKSRGAEGEEPLSDFPVDCVQKLQEIFSGIIGIGAITVNLEGEPLTEIHYANPFCKMMMANSKGREGCKASWRKIALRGNGDPPYMICHAGLSYLRSVIQMNDRPIALMIAGQFYINPPDPEKEAKRFEDLSNRYDIPLSKLKEAAASIPVLKRSQQELVQEWAPKVATTVQSMLCERSDLIARLQRIASLSNVQKTLPHS